MVGACICARSLMEGGVHGLPNALMMRAWALAGVMKVRKFRAFGGCRWPSETTTAWAVYTSVG